MVTISTEDPVAVRVVAAIRETQEGVELAGVGVGVELEANPYGVQTHRRRLGHRHRAAEVEVTLDVDRPAPEGNLEGKTATARNVTPAQAARARGSMSRLRLP